ncbi:TBC1 domain family member 2A [Siniperca chuatsi]|uniref:TBC1 domain family member 2A n=1 Tax=Siniperca chuatsi TaxID=119488 RepID=UPI001CE0B4B6|nr:TBC1 domain family member 2A [Siniperca chuatsi]XP_044060443.1 TBC1 domain family member 2A [Siniperca chuatsi]XP_044060444.1 TBC1 domain family member 2A [Siniperca chuatsi]
MDGSGSAGNPSAASSRSLPAHADEATLQPADWISASEEDGGQSRESVNLPRSPAKTQQTAAKPDQLDLTQHTNHEDPPTEKHKPEYSPTKPDQLKPKPLATDEQKLGNSPPTEKQKKDSSQKDQLKPEDRTEPKTEPNAGQPKPEKTSPAKPNQTKLDPLPTEQQKLGASPPTDKKKTKDSPSPKHQPKPDRPPPTKPQPPRTVQKKPGGEHEQKPDDSQEHHTQEDLCLTNQKTEEDPPPPPLKDLTEFHVSESKDQQNHQDPPPEKLTSTTPERHQDHQDPPPPHLNTQKAPPPPRLKTQKAPPPPADRQNHLSSLQVLPPIVHPTEASTLAPPVQAPPLTIEGFCDQVQPRPPVSPSGEPKLCGFLQKQGGPLRAWKQRWFTYEEKKNQLFYYRTPQDVTPLGRVELCSATFTYPLKAESGTFHIKTPERTFILKAVTQELMLYWLQQLQVKRWQHRQTSTCPDPTNNNNTADDFLPVLKSPLGLVGEAAANVPSQRTQLANMSIKHPLIEIQNSVHSLRKRSSQECSQSVFHVEAPPWIPPNSPNNTAGPTHKDPPAPRTPTEPPTPPSPFSLADPAGQVSPAEGRESPSLFDSWSRKAKNRSSSTLPVLRRDTLSSDRMTRLQQEKQILMEEVKAQKELVWILHKSLEASQLEKRSCAEFLAEEGEQERLELLRHRERQAADLRGQLEEAKTEVEAKRRSLAQRDAQLAELQENIRILMEKNNAKQEVIMKLSDQVTACMSDPRRPVSSSGGSLDSQTFRQLQQEVENLKDDIEAYKTQNKFLNSEIYQLTNLWRNSSEQEKSLMVKCAYLEASNCQVESRYLGVLRTLQETKTLDPVQRVAVQKMIEDALKGELKSVIKLNTARDHDEYGFKIIPDYEVEDMKLLAKIQALEIRSHNLLQQEGAERPLLSRWAQYLAGRLDGDLCPSPELKGLLRGGVPREYRQRVWHWVVRARTRTIREHHPQRYQQLCEKSRTSPHPASRQIQLDLHRTLTTNQHFSSPSSLALQQLRRVLLAFSWQNPDIGYCQGLNRLAAIALLVLQSEEDAFWCLVAVVEAIMPQDYYTKNLVASQADQWVLKDFLAEKLPRLAAHFEDHSIDVSLITFNWFLVVFVESLPSDILLPLWDAFLYEGTKVIFRYALALFKYKEDDILKIHDSVEIYQYLRFFTKTITDGRRLTGIAFSDMNPFPGRLLRNRRALHLERLQGELRELEEQQRQFVTESVVRKDKELDNVASEDDEEL